MVYNKYVKNKKMQYRSLLWILRFIALIAFFGVLYFVFYLSPYVSQISFDLITWNIVVFEIILLIFLSAIFSILLFWIRRIGRKGLVKNEKMLFMGIISIRQGILLGFCAIILLVLQSFNILTWWDGLLAVGAILMLELYFLVK